MDQNTPRSPMHPHYPRSHPPSLPHCFGGFCMHRGFLWHLITETALGLRIQCGALRAAHEETQGKEPGPRCWRHFFVFRWWKGGGTSKQFLMQVYVIYQWWNDIVAGLRLKWLIFWSNWWWKAVADGIDRTNNINISNVDSGNTETASKKMI